jgi:hypothetical protein
VATLEGVRTLPARSYLVVGAVTAGVDNLPHPRGAIVPGAIARQPVAVEVLVCTVSEFAVNASASRKIISSPVTSLLLAASNRLSRSHALRSDKLVIAYM